MREVDRKTLAMHTYGNTTRPFEQVLGGLVVCCLVVWLLFALFGCGGQAASEEPQAGERIVEVRDGSPVYSAENHGLQPLDAEEQAELGQTAAPLVFAYSGTRQPGFVPDTEVSCVTTGGSSQNCIVPPMEHGLTKSFVYYLEGGFGPRINGFGVARYDVYSQLDQMWIDLKAQGAYTTGTLALKYRETFDLDDPDLTFVIEVSDSGDFCSGTSSKGNVCFTGSTTGMMHDSSLVGVYHRMVNVPVIHIDYNAIRTKAGWTAIQKQNALQQAVYLAFLKGIGQGPKNISGSTRCDQTDVLKDVWCTLPPNAACKLNGWGDFGDDGFVWLGGVNCGD